LLAAIQNSRQAELHKKNIPIYWWGQSSRNWLSTF